MSADLAAAFGVLLGYVLGTAAYLAWLRWEGRDR